MKKRLFICAIVMILLPAMAGAVSDEWVNISGRLKNGETPKVSPLKVSVERGSKPLLWANGSDTPVRIKFGRGETCKEISHTEMIQYKWALLPGCIVTQPVSPRAIIEMWVDEPGVFDWQVEFAGTDKKIMGTMAVF
jgi:hypothetical protein